MTEQSRPTSPAPSDQRPGGDERLGGTEQVADAGGTAVAMGASGMSGEGAGAFASSAAVSGDARSATGAVTASGRRLRLRFPDSPGGSGSPQAPGARPDFSTIPGERAERAPRVAEARVPLSQAGTAAGIMGFHDLAEGEPDDQERWELGLTSFEEQRKAQPALRTPTRPVSDVSGLGIAAWTSERAALPAGEAPEAATPDSGPRPLAALTDPRNRPAE